MKVSPIHVKSFHKLCCRIWLPLDMVRNLMFNLDVKRSIWKEPHVSLVSSKTFKSRDHSVEPSKFLDSLSVITCTLLAPGRQH